MRTDAARRVCQERWATSKRVNADVPERFGLRQLPVRGLQKVKCIAVWMALACNVIRFAPELLSVSCRA